MPATVQTSAVTIPSRTLTTSRTTAPTLLPSAAVQTRTAPAPLRGPGGSATIGSGLSCASFTPLAVRAAGIGLSGLQFNFKTPNTISTKPEHAVRDHEQHVVHCCLRAHPRQPLAGRCRKQPRIDLAAAKYATRSQREPARLTDESQLPALPGFWRKTAATSRRSVPAFITVYKPRLNSASHMACHTLRRTPIPRR